MEKIPIDQEAKAREWALRHMEFFRPDSDLLKQPKKVKTMPAIKDEPEKINPMEEAIAATKRYFCGFCPREFELERSMITHQSRCKQNPNAKHWDRGTPRKKRGAPKGNKNASKPIMKPDATKLQPAVSEDLLKAIAEDNAKPYEPKAATATVKSGYIQATVTPPVPQHSATDPIYYLIMAILSLVALCLMVAAALGIKLLVGL